MTSASAGTPDAFQFYQVGGTLPKPVKLVTRVWSKQTKIVAKTYLG